MSVIRKLASAISAGMRSLRSCALPAKAWTFSLRCTSRAKLGALWCGAQPACACCTLALGASNVNESGGTGQRGLRERGHYQIWRRCSRPNFLERLDLARMCGSVPRCLWRRLPGGGPGPVGKLACCLGLTNPVATGDICWQYGNYVLHRMLSGPSLES